MEMEIWRRNFLLLCGLLEAILFSGCIFGWPSLLFILQQEGVYNHLCKPNETIEIRPNFPVTDVLIDSGDMDYNVHYQSMTSSYIPTHNTESQKSDYKDTTTNDCVGQSCTSIHNQNLHDQSVKRKCDAQQVDLTLVYTFAAVIYGITAVFIGMSLEFLGIKISRVIGSTITCAGFIFLAYTTSERWYFLWPSLNLIAIGSNLLRFSGFQFAELWPKYRATILTSYSAGYAISTSLFILIQLIYERDIPMRLIFLCCAGICCLTYIPTFIIPGKKKSNLNTRDSVTQTEDEDMIMKITTTTLPADNDTGESKTTIEMQTFVMGDDENGISDTSSVQSEGSEPMSPIMQKLSATLKSVLSLSGLLHAYWHFINLYLILFYSSTFYMWTEKVANNHEKISFYIKMSGICSVIGPIFAPFSGFATDIMTNRAKLRNNELERIGYRMQAPTYSMFIATCLLAMTMTCKLFFTEIAIFISFALIAVSRPAVVGSCISYIHLRFPEDQFNILNGFFTTFISIVCFVQYPIMKWLVISDAEYIKAHIVLLGMLLASLVSPAHMMFRKVMMKYARERWMDNLRESTR